MNSETIIYCIFAFILGILVFHMLKYVCGCKVIEGLQNQSCNIDSDFIKINDRYYKEWNIGNSNITDVLILYYHGYNNCPNQIEPYIDGIEEFVNEEYSGIKITIASLLGNNYNGTSSWNISNYPNNFDPDFSFGTGYGINNKNLNTCINSDTDAINGNFGTNNPGTDCQDNFTYNGCRWTSCSNDILFTRNVIDKYKYNNPNLKVYAIGFSTGAMFVYTLPNFISDINKIVTFAGNIPFGLLVPKSDTSILDFHGNEDYTVPGITSSKKQKHNCSIKNKNTINFMVKYLNNNYNINIDVNNLKDHYICDTDSHKYLYHNTNDLLIKISGNNSQIIDINNINNIINSLNYIDKDNSNITKIYKYNNNVYSIEWSGGHGIPIINNNNTNDSTPFNMAIEFFLNSF